MCAHKTSLLIKLDKDSAQPLYAQVYKEIRGLILDGALDKGDKLPAIRSFSKELGVAHSTIERAYLQLSAEGFVENKPRSGYVVKHIDYDYFNTVQSNKAEEVRRLLKETQIDGFSQEVIAAKKTRYDFAFANLQPGSFPTRIWGQLYMEALKDGDESALSSYSISEESCRLQKELAKQLQQARGVVCEPEQIVFQAGTEAALASLMQLQREESLVIGHEEPGFEVVTSVARRFGFELCPLPSDSGESAYIEALERSNSKVVFTTPSHQFPTGRLLGLDARVRLLQWAEENDAYIIEDDSCNEYRYDTTVIPSLYSLDRNDRVIYLCNFSKALSPALRIAYMVLPPKLMSLWRERFTFSWDSIPHLEKETLALFIQRGHWDSHLRRMVTGNKRRHDALVEALTSEFGDNIEMSGVDTGMHLFVTVHNGMTQEELIDSARRHGVSVYGTKRYWFANTPPENKVMIGFSAIKLEDIRPGVRRLREAWFGEGVPRSSRPDSTPRS